jgi:hypothetical protein
MHSNAIASLLTRSAAAALVLVSACAREAAPAPADDKQALIAEALSAAPSAVAAIATVKSWDGETLKEGSEEWVCYPSMPDRKGVCPMCLDKPWQAWLAAVGAGEAPPTGTLGISYMLRGDCEVSNVDPAAMSPTPDNEWVHEGPHIMLLAPDVEQLANMPHDHQSGAPYVMWRGTPYAHIMVPLPKEE